MFTSRRHYRSPGAGVPPVGPHTQLCTRGGALVQPFVAVEGRTPSCPSPSDGRCGLRALRRPHRGPLGVPPCRVRGVTSAAAELWGRQSLLHLCDRKREPDRAQGRLVRGAQASQLPLGSGGRLARTASRRPLRHCRQPPMRSPARSLRLCARQGVGRPNHESQSRSIAAEATPARLEQFSELLCDVLPVRYTLRSRHSLPPSR